VSALAADLDLSVDHFIRAFKRQTGYSPHGLASHLSVEEAKLLLRETRRSITDIAMELGYSSPAHFSARFRQLAGMSPTEWRATYTH
jgi:AraC family transcriptional regulator